MARSIDQYYEIKYHKEAILKEVTYEHMYLFYEKNLRNEIRETTLKEMKALVKEMKTQASSPEVGCFTVIVMTHGKKREDGSVDLEFSDGGFISLEYIISEVAGTTKSYVGQPNLFFFQCCRGKESDHGFLESNISTDSPLPMLTSETPSEPLKFPKYRDVFVAFPCPLGNKGNRDANEGAWFIQAIVKVFFMHAHELTFTKLMDKVSDDLYGKAPSHDEGFNIGAYEKRGFDKDLQFVPTMKVHTFLEGDEHKDLREKLGLKNASSSPSLLDGFTQLSL